MVLRVRYFCKGAAAVNRNKLYANTVLLPKTECPLRLQGKKLIDRDAAINNDIAFKRLYEWQRNSLNSSDFILHDGPPYANGLSHMGHAINKILKDAILRQHILEGKRVHYVPGWDCHGLPIELKAISSTKSTLRPIQIWNIANAFATQTVDQQLNTFQTWGLVGDWKKPYLTSNKLYIQNQMKQFYKLYKKDLVYRDFKPVYWSPSSRTALAEAELEYNAKHKSISVIVRLRISRLSEEIYRDAKENTYVLIWTTTPWTLPGNQAVCFSPDLSYSIVQKSDCSDLYIVATDLVKTLSDTLNENFKILNTFSGSMLSGTTYHHPFRSSRILPLLPGNHVTGVKGTGLVHVAAAHGLEDFLVALTNKLPVHGMVDEGGCFTEKAGKNLKGLSVLSDGTSAVLDILKNEIVHKEDFIHSYPYDWRTKEPVIIRASQQWFIDTDRIKDRAIELLKNVDILPKANSDIYRKKFVQQLLKRPYWCISRQRSWGVPIPVFYNTSTGKHIINEEVINRQCHLLDKYGTNYWWKLPLNVLVTENMTRHMNIYTEIEKSQDIMDIWLDSGISWSSVLEGGQVADLYLEGLDQFTGWFQSSLLTSAALRDKAPYKTIYVHGFAVDDKGLKMSKSLGNVVNPQDILIGTKEDKAYGVDTLRWWVCCHANQESVVQISKNVLDTSAEEVQKIRSTLRYILGALYDYENSEIVPDYNTFLIVDKYLLHLLWSFQTNANSFLQDYQFNKLCIAVIHFLTNSVSALYYMAIKDRLYCNMAEDLQRKAAQFVLLEIFNVITRSIAPIVPHLAEELYTYFPLKKEGTYFENYILKEDKVWQNHRISDLMEIVLKIKQEIHKVASSTIVESHVSVKVSTKLFEEFLTFQDDQNLLEQELTDIFQVSRVTLIEDSDITEEQKFSIHLKNSDKNMCGRCRRCNADLGNDLCKRCNFVVNNFSSKAAAEI